MFDWLKKLLPQPPQDEQEPLSPDEALAQLRGLITDAVIEDIWDSMDLHAVSLEPRVREMLVQDELGEYPRQASTLWLAYQLGKSDRPLDPFLHESLPDAVAWAFQFEDNHVLLGGALGALDGLSAEEREALALDVFERLGEESVRRYWFLLKVRSDAMLAAVAEGLETFEPELRPKMGGAFRQFKPEDIDVLLAHYDAESPGAELWLEALGSTGSDKARPVIEEALDDVRPRVRESAELALRLLEMSHLSR